MTSQRLAFPTITSAPNLLLLRLLQGVNAVNLGINMVYSTRNSFYLRISKTVVLPLYIYLDERHVNWMSDKVLQHVLSDLRPHILGKLRAESDSVLGGKESTQKKVSVDTHRGETYQFCYFLRRTVPHSLLIKSRSFALAPAAAKAKAGTVKAKSRKRKETTQESPPIQLKKRKTKRKTSPAMVTSDDEANQAGPSEEEPNDSDDEYLPENHIGTRREREPDPEIMDIDIVEEEEEKPKPVLGLTYHGFNLYGQCLCVVVEPWPIMRTTTTPLMLSGHGIKLKSNTASVKEPLFLPEEPEDNAPNSTRLIVQDTPVEINKAYLDQVLHDGQVADVHVEDDEADDDMGGMIEFSQIIYYSGDIHSGAINDDDADESILFGDADEIKEL